MEEKVIVRLYDISETLDKSGADVQKHVELYKEMLKSSKSKDGRIKRLAAQLIPRHFKQFPTQADSTIDAIINLCEDEDIQIRIATVRGFPNICKDNPSVVTRFVDLLGQLLKAESSHEVDNAKNTLVTIVRQSPKEVLSSLFAFLNREDIPRAKVIQFLKERVYPIRTETVNTNPETENLVATYIKRILSAEPNLPADEFGLFVDFLSSLKSFKGEAAKELLPVILNQAGMKSDIKLEDAAVMERFISCLNLALPFIQPGETVSKLVKYITDTILPSFEKISDTHKLSFLKALADLSPFVESVDARILFPVLYKLMESQIPADSKSEVKVNISYIECLLFAFHQLAPRAPGALRPSCGITILTGQPADMPDLSEDVTGKLKSFQQRMNYLHEQALAYNKKLTEAMKSTQDEKKKETMLVATVTTSNIAELTKRLLQRHLVFVTPQSIRLSWHKKEAKRKIPEKKSLDQMQAENQSRRQPHNNSVKEPQSKKPRAQNAPTNNTPNGNNGKVAARPFSQRGRGRGKR